MWGKNAIFAENMKKVNVCRFKKVRFPQPIGAKLKICKKKTQYIFAVFMPKKNSQDHLTIASFRRHNVLAS